MSELTITATYVSYLDYIGANNGTYATSHDAANGNQVGTCDLVLGGANTITLLQSFIAGGLNRYHVYRAGLYFDCATLPLSASISTAKLQLYVNSDNSVTDSNVTVVSGTDLDFPAVAADYGELLNDTVSYGAWSTANFPVPDAYVDIDLNATGIAAITKAGITKFGLRSSRDIGNNAPTTLEWINIGALIPPPDECFPPKLVITYTTFIPKIFYF